jgi:outer membrane receptor protein involved in Fe transport
VPRNFGVRTGLIDVQRVEALRGPQGTLYGRNTTGGAVSIVTQDPKDELGAVAQASFGNYNAWQVTGILNVPIAEGVGVRLLGQLSDHRPYGRQVATGAKLLSEESTYLRGKIKFDRGAVKLVVSGDYFNFKSGAQVWHLAGLTPANAAETRFSGRVCVPNTALAGGTGPLGSACTPTGGGARCRRQRHFLRGSRRHLVEHRPHPSRPSVHRDRAGCGLRLSRAVRAARRQPVGRRFL